MAIFERCTLCQPINIDDIVAQGLVLPLGPYRPAWQKGSVLPPQCGICKLLNNCLYTHRLWDDESAILLFKYNAHHRIIVVVATTEHFATTSIRLELLCGPFAEQWSYDSRSRYSCAFLRMNTEIGMLTQEVKASMSNFQAQGDPRNSITSHRLLSTNPGSSKCLDIARRWLMGCSEHAKDYTNFLPSRLIDVRPDSDDDTAVLVSLCQDVDGDKSCPIKYAALSYCWGTGGFLTTTSLNIDALMHSISISQLPRTIRDAIKIIRHLGIRYLWVDSLCIIQGTDKAAQRDWLSQSTMMGQIYQSAHFTISAESASTALAGILNDRKRSPLDICPIPISAGSSNMMYLTQHQFMEPDITEPLHLRGWTMQETILSRRLLKFGTYEMSWRCPHGIKREALGEAPETSLCDASDYIDAIKGLNNHQAHDIYTGWQTMIEDYSRRVITVKSDKLHAIAGLAKTAQSSTDDVYIAGVWARGVPFNLLWMHIRPKLEYLRTQDSRVPTWSWASVEGPVQFLQKYDRIEDLIIEWKLCDGHAAVDLHKRQGLFITGRMVQLDSIRCHLFGEYYGGYDAYLPWGRLPDTLRTYMDDLDDIPSINKKGGEEDPAELVNSWFLLLARRYDVYTSVGAGLILLRTESTQQCFRRIGMFEGFPLSDFYELERDARNARLVWQSLVQWKKSPSTAIKLE